MNCVRYSRPGSSPPEPRPGRPRARRLSRVCIVALLLGALGPLGAAPASAQVLVSNIDQTTGETRPFGTHRSQAQPFRTGNHPHGYTLTSIEWSFHTAVTDPSEIRAELWSAGPGDAPNSKIVSLTVPASVGTGAVAFSAPAGTRLERNTDYNAVIYQYGSTDPGGILATTDSNSPVTGPRGGAIIPTRSYHKNTAIDSGSWTSSTRKAMKIRVNGTQNPPPSTDATLSALTGNVSTDNSDFSTALTLKPEFDKDTTAYTAEVAGNVTHVKLTPTANDSKAKLKVGVQGGTLADVDSGSASAAIPVPAGETAIEVVVTPESGDGDKKTYTVKVKRPSRDATLSALILEDTPDGTTWTRRNRLVLNFRADRLDYGGILRNASTQVRLTATTNHAGATLSIALRGSTDAVDSGVASDPILLSVGENIIDVVVTPESGDTDKKTYTVTVTRLPVFTFTATGIGGACGSAISAGRQGLGANLRLDPESPVDLQIQYRTSLVSQRWSLGS